MIVFEREGLQYVKRIIGMPGDEIDITEDGTVLVNGKSMPMKDTCIWGGSKAGRRRISGDGTGTALFRSWGQPFRFPGQQAHGNGERGKSMGRVVISVDGLG